MALCAAIAAACSAGSSPDISLDLSNPNRPAVILSGLARRDLRALEAAASRAENVGWTPLFRVSVAPQEEPGAVAVSGEYTVSNGMVRFTPVLPFEGGRTYYATFDPGAARGGTLAHLSKLTRQLSTPAPPQAPPVHVGAVYPSGPMVAANLLRMYVEFSGAMGILPGEHYITLLDADGNEISGALLPLDTELWNREHTRFTILFDPGRVKRGILPNRAMGRPLKEGGSFTLLVRREWPDAQGRPLDAEFRKTYRVGPAVERPITPADWRIAAPAAGSRDPVVVTFATGLDRGLLQRALNVSRGREAVPGDTRVGAGETQWTFAPQVAWAPGDYTLVVQPELEDPAGNRIGRAFEARDPADDTRLPPARVPFTVR